MLMPAPHLKILYKDCKRKKGELRHMFKKSRTELAAERLTTLTWKYQSQTMGSETVEVSGHQDSIKLDMLSNGFLENNEKNKQKKLELMPKPSQGYGGKFGVETDRIDKCAAGFDYKGKVEPHPSQKDYSRGFGGTFGVEADRVDKSALGWDSREQLQQYESQKDYKNGFGGQLGVQSDRKDKSAAGWEDHEQLQRHILTMTKLKK
uniref:Uncharacterized protein n=1 Tax=Meloidogyne incognita TaxID=6306 RepID=A0A914LR98_MELIC